MNGFPDLFAEDKMVFEDARKMQNFYPAAARQIRRYVEDECDKLEYEGSMMFDEYPDSIMLFRLSEKIREQVEKDAAEAGEQKVIVMQEADRGWLGDLIQVVLVEEMHRRRCRHRRCRKNRRIE